MIDKLTLKSTHRFCERGSILPVALGMGAIMSLAAGTMLVRSHNDQISVATRDAIVKSEAVAELGITRYKDLINKYRQELPVRRACDNWNSDGTCSDVASTFPPTWHSNPEMFVDAADLQEFKGKITRTWQNVSADPKDGQYRLWEYNSIRTDDYTGTGTLTVEGRVNQGADGTEGSGTATRRLEVTFPVQLGLCTGVPCAERIGANTSWEIIERK